MSTEVLLRPLGGETLEITSGSVELARSPIFDTLEHFYDAVPDAEQAFAFLAENVGVFDGGILREDTEKMLDEIAREAAQRGCEYADVKSYPEFRASAHELIELRVLAGQLARVRDRSDRSAEPSRVTSTQQAIFNYFTIKLGDQSAALAAYAELAAGSSERSNQALAVQEPATEVAEFPLDKAVGQSMEWASQQTHRAVNWLDERLQATEPTLITAKENFLGTRQRRVASFVALSLLGSMIPASVDTAEIIPAQNVEILEAATPEIVEPINEVEPENELAAVAVTAHQHEETPATQPEVPDEREVDSSDIPDEYTELYQAAAAAEGIDWTILAGIGKIETDHGQSSAKGVTEGQNFHGCCAGPMQFFNNEAMARLPKYKMRHSVWTEYGVDGNNDGQKNVYDPADAIPAAARKLVANGLKNNIEEAIWSYNRSHKYYHDVMAWAAYYAGNGERPS